MTRELAAYSTAAASAAAARQDAGLYGAGTVEASEWAEAALFGESDLAEIRQRLLWTQLTMSQTQLLAAFNDARSSGYLEGSRHMMVLRRAERTERRCDALWRRQQRDDQPVAQN